MELIDLRVLIVNVTVFQNLSFTKSDVTSSQSVTCPKFTRPQSTGLSRLWAILAGVLSQAATEAKTILEWKTQCI